MKLEELYAHALYETQSKEPKKVLDVLRQTLRARGHEKLLPKIYSEYEKLQVRAKRLAMHKTVTPERERTRVLLELYNKLVAAK